MKPYRKISVVVGILFLTGTVAGILSGVVMQPILTVPNYLQNIAAHEAQWLAGVLLILVMGLPLAMVPVALFPILRKQNEVVAIGAIIFRGALEAIAYVLMVLCFLMLLTVGQQASISLGASQLSGFQYLGSLLLSANEWIAILLAVVFSIGSIMINLLLYQMKVIPRWLSGWGLSGSILYLAAALVSLLSPQHPAVSFDTSTGFLIVPLALQEMVFAAWLLVKGFNPSWKSAPSTFPVMEAE
jgi:hypothetical protein